jgi:hypothetical protein
MSLESREDHASPDPRSAAGLESVALFCGSCSCGCPELFLDSGADDAHRVVLTDDFGQRIQMSLEQLSVMVADIKGGAVDRALGASAF